ncbi:MAG: hypothetical protein MK105_00045 [Crocinitomicaceae bacterium]|nr:hypothetical protein [Crocinitomicaceae bacterium]
MTRTICILITFLTLSISSLAQTDSTKYTLDTSTMYKNLDTLNFYSVGLRAESSNKSEKYWVNNKRVDKIIYLKYKSVWDNIHKCKPCYLKTYDENDKLIKEGFQYTDCGVGIWTEYYSNGEIKTIGHFKENNSDNWNDLWNRGYCSRKEGLWKYYDENGNVTKTEKYLDGKLID